MAQNTELQTLALSSRAALSEQLITKTEAFFGADIDTSKGSFQSYINERLSELSSDMVLYNSFLFNERYINTARFRSSVLNRGYESGYVEQNVEPEKLFSYIGIKLTDADLTKSLESFKVPQNTLSFASGPINYMLTGNLTISLNNGIWSVFMDDLLTDYSTRQLQSQLIEVTNLDATTDVYLMFQVELLQLNITSKNELITYRETLDYYRINVDITNDLYDMKVYYFDQNDNKIYLERLQNFLDIDSDFNKDVFTVRDLDDTTKQIVLDNGLRFHFLSTGTELFIDLYETIGVEGRVKAPTFEIINDITDFTRSFVAYSELESSGGVNKLALNDLKRDVIKSAQTPDGRTIVTKFDYENVLSNITGVGVEDLVLLMRRNDPIVRRTDLFMKMFDYKNELLQTNTADLLITDFTAQTGVNGAIARGTRFKEEIIADKPHLIIVGDADATGTHYYRSLLPQAILSVPTHRLATFNLGTDYYKTAKEVFNNTFNLSLSLFSNHVTCSYDSIAMEYTFSTTILSNDLTKINDATFMDTVSMRLLFSNNSELSTTNSRHFYVDLTRDVTSNKTNVFTGKIQVEEKFTQDGHLLAKNVYGLSGGTYTLNTLLETPIEQTNYIESYIFTNNVTDKVNDDSSELTVVEYNSLFATDAASSTLFSKQEFIDNNLFKDLSELFSSDVNYVGNTEVHVSSVPVIGEDDYNNANNADKLNQYAIIFNKLNDEVFMLREEPSVLAIKFFNTYGTTIDYGAHTTSEVSLQIELSYNVNESSPTIINDIKQIINDYVNQKTSLTVTSSIEKNIYLSDLISQIRDNTAGIIQLRILNLSDNIYFTGYTDLKNVPSGILTYYTPPLLNVRTENVSFIVK